MKNIIIKPSTSLFNALSTMNDYGEKCLVVVDNSNILLGTLSDGDLRKAILKGTDMSALIENIYNKNPIFFQEGMFSKQEAKDCFLNNKFNIIPVINETNIVIDVLIWDKVFENGNNSKKSRINASVVVMAGGRGARLEPFTKVFPKPLVPLNDKPVIEHIIDSFNQFSINDFHITVNYKSRLIKAFFEELQPEYSVSFVDEEVPLGTAGSLRYLIGTFDNPFFVTNCDIIIDTDYADLYTYHLENKYDVTLVVATKNYTIPYGTCELNEDGELDHIKEKPEYNFLVNTGLYVLNPEVLTMIPEGSFYDFTKLIEDVKKQGMKVGVYPVSESTWVDVGHWKEYHKALEHFRL
jgi:dTDP-glucose pyrophosphorylase